MVQHCNHMYTAGLKYIRTRFLMNCGGRPCVFSLRAHAQEHLHLFNTISPLIGGDLQELRSHPVSERPVYMFAVCSMSVSIVNYFATGYARLINTLSLSTTQNVRQTLEPSPSKEPRRHQYWDDQQIEHTCGSHCFALPEETGVFVQMKSSVMMRIPSHPIRLDVFGKCTRGGSDRTSGEYTSKCVPSQIPPHQKQYSLSRDISSRLR